VRPDAEMLALTAAVERPASALVEAATPWVVLEHPERRVHRRDRGRVVRSCPPDIQRYLPAEEETYLATAWIWAGVSVCWNDGMTPPPTIT